MAQTEHLPINKAAYDCCLYFEQLVRNLPRYYKYSIGQDLHDGARRVLKLIVRANARADKSRIGGALSNLEWAGGGPMVVARDCAPCHQQTASVPALRSPAAPLSRPVRQQARRECLRRPARQQSPASRRAHTIGASPSGPSAGSTGTGQRTSCTVAESSRKIALAKSLSAPCPSVFLTRKCILSC